jgi:hypothetical protein
MKDNAQETIGNYNGNARPGEIVADLTTDPPVLYIGNNLGELTQIGSGGPANTGDWTFSDGNATTTVSEPIFVTGFTGEGASLNSDEWAQLYWSANVNGNVDVFNPVNGGDLYAWAYVDNGGFTVQYKDVANTVDHTWQFDITGNLITAGNTVIGPSPAGGGSILQYDAPLQVVGEGANSFVVAGWAETLSGPGNVAVIGFNSPFGNGAANVTIVTGNNGGTQYNWNFGNDGNLIFTQGSKITEVPSPVPGNYALALTGTGVADPDQQLLIYPTFIDANHLHLTSGNLYNTELFLGNDDLYVKLANTGNIVINSNDSAGNIAQWSFEVTGALHSPTVDFANLIPAAGARAFVNNANLVAAGNFGAQISGGGSNTVPVWSDGTNWYIG